MPAPKTDAQIAAAVGVGTRSVQQYRAVETKVRPVAPEIADAVDAGEVSVSAAAKIANVAEAEPDVVQDAAASCWAWTWRACPCDRASAPARRRRSQIKG